MKALRFYGSKDLRVEETASPKICGPRQVIVRVAWCGIIESWGLCTEVFDPTTEDVPAQIRERTTVGVDAAIECAGNENSLAACLQAVRRQGTVVQVGLPTVACNLDLQLLVIKDVTLRGSFCYPIYSWPRVIGLIAARKLPVEKVVSSRVNLDAAIPDGFEQLSTPGTDRLKVLVQPTA
jgi:(R,R)-butanediol dehydrogenase / meso-butanediol dehydrogenase / diacetyl reductase